MYKLYEYSYYNSATQECYCKDIVASDNPEQWKKSCEENINGETVEYEEFKFNGFEIVVNKVGE